MKQLIAFDLDGMLVQSKQPFELKIGAALAALLAIVEVAISSGGDWSQFEKQVLAGLPAQAHLSRLSIGGSAAIAITQKDVDKGNGLRRLAEQSGLLLTGMLSVGDAIYPGGNDYPLREAGVDSIAVRGVAEIQTVMATIAAWVGNHAQ